MSECRHCNREFDLAVDSEIERLRDELEWTRRAVFDAVSFYSSEDCGHGRGVDFIEESRDSFYLAKQAERRSDEIH